MLLLVLDLLPDGDAGVEDDEGAAKHGANNLITPLQREGLVSISKTDLY